MLAADPPRLFEWKFTDAAARAYARRKGLSVRDQFEPRGRTGGLARSSRGEHANLNFRPIAVCPHRDISFGAFGWLWPL